MGYLWLIVLLLIALVLIWATVEAVVEAVANSLHLPTWGAAWLLIGVCALCIWWVVISKRRKFLREAPKKIQDLMATCRENLVNGAGILDAAESELEAGRAPLFWDEMDRFPDAIHRCRVDWNAAADIADRCETLSTRPFSRHHDLVTPDMSLPATVAEIGERWKNLRDRSLTNQSFASIFEQRRQADKIADRLREQDAAILTAIDRARRAEQVASQAHTAAKQASVKAGSALGRASSAKSVANEARWSKI